MSDATTPAEVISVLLRRQAQGEPIPGDHLYVEDLHALLAAAEGETLLFRYSIEATHRDMTELLALRDRGLITVIELFDETSWMGGVNCRVTPHPEFALLLTLADDWSSAWLG